MESSSSGSNGGGLRNILKPFLLIWDVVIFLWYLISFAVITPLLILWEIIRTLISMVATHLPLLAFLAFTVAFTVAFVDQEKVIIQTVEQAWRCTIVPLFLAPLPTGVRALIVPYEEGICYYNALGFTNRILSKKSITEILANDPNKLSVVLPGIYIIRGIFDAIARIGRWFLSFYNARFPVFPILSNIVTPVTEILLRVINALCRDLHSPFFYLGRVITQERLYCALDNLINSAIARFQYWFTFLWDLVITILSLLSGGFISNFDGFIDNFRTQISDVSPVLNIPSERQAMGSIHVGEFLNEAIHSLICTIVTEVELYTLDSTLVNGTIPPSHTSFPLASNETYLNEDVYIQCMNDTTKPYYFNIFGAFGHLGAAFPRYLFVNDRIFPTNLFRIAWEFFTLAGPVSDDGSAGYNINTPIPNNSTRFLMSGVPIDSIWDTIRRPLDTLRQSSTIERWPYIPLFGKNSILYDPMENTTTTCGNASYGAPPAQDNLFCKECRYNRTEANVVSQIEILARNLDDLLEPYLLRRLFHPLLFEVGGGLIRTGVAAIKAFYDIPRHVGAGFDEGLIFFARMNYYDVVFDEFAGKPHELGGVLNGTVNFFAAIHPSLHIFPKIIILPAKFAVELLRNIVRLIPILLNTLIGIGGNPTYGPRISEFFCLDGSPDTCINVEEQFIKWLRTPRNLTEIQIIVNSMRRTMPNTGVKVFNLGIGVVDRVRINDVFNEVANNYTGLLYGDVYDPNVTVPPYKFGWLECFRYLLSPAFVNSFIPNPVDYITTSQFPDITCSIYYAGRAAAEAIKAGYEFIISILQTIFDLFSNTNPNMPAVLFRWLACTDSQLCIPLLEILSDAQDLVQCPCHFLGDTFLNVPCLCNVTNSLGLGAVDLLRASLNIELASSQLIVCITEFPGGATNVTSRGCYAIVFDRVIDIFTKIDNATTDVSNFGAGLGCVVGLLDPVPCGTLPSGLSLSSFTSDLGYYLVQFVLSIIRSVLHLVESFFVYLRNVVIGLPPGSNPSENFTLRFVVETVLNGTITPLVGDPNDPSTHGLVQSLGRSFSCLFGTTTCTITDDDDNLCPGWFLVKLGNAIRNIYKCLIKMIGNFIGAFENLIKGDNVIGNILGFFEGFGCLVLELVINILELVIGIIGGFLDTIFNTGTTITEFLSMIADSVKLVIDILSGLFFDIGEAFECSVCWTECQAPEPEWDFNGDDCIRCYCRCKCQRPVFPSQYCYRDWDNSGAATNNEVWTPVNGGSGQDCPAREAGDAVIFNRTVCWSGCLSAMGYNDIFSTSNLTVLSPTICPACYCQCQVQPDVSYLMSFNHVDTAACLQDWDGDSIVETLENYTSAGTIAIWNPPGNLSYSCSVLPNASQLLECVSCWWHAINSSMVVNQSQYTTNYSIFLPITNITERLPVTATNAQCLAGWCDCKCQYPSVLDDLVRFNVDIFDQLLPVLSTINLGDPYGRINFTMMITAAATQNYTATPITIYNDSPFSTYDTITYSGQYWWFTNFHASHCQRDWDNDGVVMNYTAPVTIPVETYMPNTTFGLCPSEMTNVICQICWESYYTGVVVGDFTSDQNCYTGWCLCGCNPTDALHAALASSLNLTSNCTRDWDNDATIEIQQYPNYTSETTNVSNPAGFPTCNTDPDQACADCWYSTLIEANPGATFNYSTCNMGWCTCQCQMPPLTYIILVSYWNSTFIFNGNCMLDWDGNGTISINETFTGANCSAKRSILDRKEKEKTTPRWTADQQNQFIQAELVNRPVLQTLYGQKSPPRSPPVASSSASATAAAVFPQVADWFDRDRPASSLMETYKDTTRSRYPPSPALGQAQNLFASLSAFVDHTQKQKRSTSASSTGSSNSNMCASYLTELYTTYQKDPSKFASTDTLLAGKGYADKAMFMGCYTLMVAPSLLNARNVNSNSLLSLPKYLFLNTQEFSYWLQSGMDAAQVYVQWRMQKSNIEVSPQLLAGLELMQRNSSRLIYNATALQGYLKNFGTLMKRQVNNEPQQAISVHVPSFADALILGGVMPNPNLRAFAEQLDQYVSRGYTNERVARQLAHSIDVAQRTTIFDGLIETVRGMRSSLNGLNPVVWARMMQTAAEAAGSTTVNSRASIKMITASFASGSGDNRTIVASSDYYGPYGNRNNPIFKVFSGLTVTDKILNVAGLYGRVWNHFKNTQLSSISTKIKAQMNIFSEKLIKADGPLRAVETYQFISEKFGESLNLPHLNPTLIDMVAKVREKQHMVSVSGLPLGTVGHMDLISNGTCNVTRCFECALIINAINDVYENFQYCTNLSQGIDSIRRFNHTTIADADLVVREYVSNDALWGLGNLLNRVALFITSFNADPFTRTGEPLGLWYYFSTYAPIPFVGYCDRDIHTTCQSGIGFGWGLLILLLLTLGIFVCWFFIPALAGVTLSFIGILGYIIFAVALLTSVSWGMNALCLQTPGVSLLAFVGVPIQLPILPQCVVRDISETLDTIVQTCFDFFKYLVVDASSDNPLVCPTCPGQLNIVDCNANGFKSLLDVYAYGLNWVLWQLGAQDSTGNLIGMSADLKLTDSIDAKCFWILFIPSSPFAVTFLLVALIYLITLVLNIFNILMMALQRLWTAKLFTRVR